MQAVSNSLWAYAKLGYNPGRELLDCTARRAGGMLHQYTSQARSPCKLLQTCRSSRKQVAV